MATKRGTRFLFRKGEDSAPESLVPVVHGLHEFFVVKEVGQQSDADIGPVARVGVEGLEPFDEARHERFVGTAFEETFVALHLAFKVGGIVFDERGVKRALRLEVVHAGALAHTGFLSSAIHGERADAFLENDAACGGDDGGAGSNGFFTAHGRCCRKE